MATSGSTTGVLEPKDVPLDYTVLEKPTIKVLPKQDPERTMRAVEFHSKVVILPANDESSIVTSYQLKRSKFFVAERYESCGAAKALITEPADVVIKVTTTCICGSDLHMYVGFMLGMKSGDVVGHEFMGIHHRGCRSRSEELQEG